MFKKRKRSSHLRRARASQESAVGKAALDVNAKEDDHQSDEVSRQEKQLKQVKEEEEEEEAVVERKDIESFAQKQMLVEGKGERGSGQPPSPGSSQQDAADKRCKDESAATKKLMRRSVQRGLAVRGRKTSSKDVAAKHFPGSRSSSRSHIMARRQVMKNTHQRRERRASLARVALRPTLERLSGSTMSPIFVRITSEQDTVDMGIIVYIYTTEAVIKVGGSWRRSGRPFRQRESVSSGEGCV